MTTRLIFGAVFLVCATWLITWLVTVWADREHAREQNERQRLDRLRQLSPEAPRAAGLRRDQRRVG